MDKFIEEEDRHQDAFAKIEMNFEGKRLLYVNLFQLRNVTVCWLRDLISAPDPSIRISCPSLPAPNTFVIKVEYSPASDINETVRFVLPSVTPRPCLIEIELIDRDILFNDILAKYSIDISEMNDGTLYKKCVEFTAPVFFNLTRMDRGELDITVKIDISDSPDFRLSLSLSEEERSFRKVRIPIVYKKLKELYREKGPENIVETPVMSIGGSGGGYRASIAMAGAMEAINEAGLLDAFTYSAGISGSGWYMLSAYTRQGCKPEKQKEFHDFLRDSLSINLWWKLVSPDNIVNILSYMSKTKRTFSQPHSLIDWFGYTAGSLFLGQDKLEVRLSDLRQYISDGSVPYPLLVALHVKNRVLSSEFHSYAECSPHEVCFPTYGIGIPPEKFGSEWSSGFVVRECPEFPIHFIQGVLGSASAIFAMTNIATGEKSEKLLERIVTFGGSLGRQHTLCCSRKVRRHEPPKVGVERRLSADSHRDPRPARGLEQTMGLPYLMIIFADEARIKGKTKNGEKPVVKDELQSDESDDDEDMEENNRVGVTEDKPTSDDPKSSTELETSEMSEHSSKESEEKKSFLACLKKVLLKSRDSIVGRTGKSLNFARNLSSLDAHLFNPFGDSACAIGSEKYEKLKRFRNPIQQRQISLTKRVLSLVDAGIYLNVPTDIMLRPQRSNDLLLVLDFSGYESDSNFDYLPLMGAAAHARQQGMKFPPINFEDIANLPPQECLVFEDKNDLYCPIVIWITLCNKAFKSQKDFKPRDQKYASMDNFKDFPVYDPETKYTLFTTSFDELAFDQLRELAYFNVMSNIDKINDMVLRAIERKRERLRRSKH